MGYSTSYKLDIEPLRKQSIDKVVEYLEGGVNWEYEYGGLLDFYTGEADSCKWYGHEKDVKNLSRKFPDFLFILSGEGEEPGDLWKKYFLDGKMQVANAKITYEKFNKKKLE